MPAPQRHRAQNGADYAEAALGGTRVYMTLHDLVPGASPLVLDDAQLGAALATFATAHRVGRLLRLTPPRMGGFTVGGPVACAHGSCAFPRLDPALPTEALECAHVFARATDEAWLRIAANKDAPSKYAIHGDIYQGNLVFDGPRLASVVDFDECHDDAAWVDMTFALESFCRPHPDRIGEVARRFFDARAAFDPSPLDRDLTFAFWLYRQATGGYARLTGRRDTAVPPTERLAAARERVGVLRAIVELCGELGLPASRPAGVRAVRR